MSDLAGLEGGTGSFTRTTLNLASTLNEAIAALPELPDREVHVRLSADDDAGGTLEGDAARLRSAFVSLLAALRRELVQSDTLHVRPRARDDHGNPVTWIAFGDAEQIDRLERADPSSLETFDEWRGGCGLSLAIARRVFAAHGGRVWSAGPEAKAGAVVLLPRTSDPVS
jgi:signal transduction histidine kinase